MSMMDELWLPFISGGGPHPLPLGRFLPPLPAGSGTAFLQAHVPAGAWLLDPIGASPTLALEAAQAGYRVLVCSNNPILSFMLEVLASAPAAADFQSTLAELARIKRGEDRFDLHLQSLYQTTCPACGQTIPAQAYLWKRGAAAPENRTARCPQCGSESETPLSPLDLMRLNPPGAAALHRARALERVSSPGDKSRAGAQEALQFFSPRSLYFLLTLTNRVEGLPVQEYRRNLLFALILSACEEAVTLWQPGGRTRPRLLTTPPVYRESNLWLALESAIPLWSNQSTIVPLTRYPSLPPMAGGICLFRGRVRNLFPLAEGISPAAIVTLFPRPNQAFWTLCAVWSGWLWGREAVNPLRSVLERRRYDWNWHVIALYATLSGLRKNLPPGIPLLGILPELVPGFLAATGVAAHAAGFALRGLSLRQELGQIVWQGELKQAVLESASPDAAILEGGILAYLQARNEPADLLPLSLAGLAQVTRSSHFPVLWNADIPASYNTGKTLTDSLTALQGLTTQVLNTSPKLRRFEGKGKSLEAGWWALKPTSPSADIPISDRDLTLADRVEMEVVRTLQTREILPLMEVDRLLCVQFPGLLTPPRELIQACLESYAEPVTTPQDGWRLREQESAASRRADLANIRQGIEQLGQHLGYRSQGDLPIFWLDEDGTPAYQLYPIASSIVSRFLNFPTRLTAQRCIIVLPGSRCNLLTFKQQTDQRLAEAMSKGWRFLKFRLIRQMLERPNLTAELFESLLDSDPPNWEGITQMTIF